MKTPTADSATMRERQLREAALVEADSLFRENGTGALAILSKRLIDRTKSAEERRYDRLTLLEVERLDRIERHGQPAQALAVWKPRLFSRAWFAGLGIGARNRR